MMTDSMGCGRILMIANTSSANMNVNTIYKNMCAFCNNRMCIWKWIAELQHVCTSYDWDFNLIDRKKNPKKHPLNDWPGYPHPSLPQICKPLLCFAGMATWGTSPECPMENDDQPLNLLLPELWWIFVNAWINSYGHYWFISIAHQWTTVVNPWAHLRINIFFARASQGGCASRIKIELCNMLPQSPVMVYNFIETIGWL